MISSMLPIYLLISIGVQFSDSHASIDRPLWRQSSPWKADGQFYKTVWDGDGIIEACRLDPKSYVHFPSIIQGAHRVEVDGHLLIDYGDSNFENVMSFYDSPDLKCEQILNASSIRWTGFSFSKQFTVDKTGPEIRSSAGGLVNGSLRLLGAGLLIAMALFGAVFFIGKVPKKMSASVVMTSVLLAISLVTTAPGFFGFPGSMVFYQKISDSTLVAGATILFYLLAQLNFLPLKLFYGLAATGSIACTMILFQSNPDKMQDGTNLAFVPWMLALGYILISGANKVRKHPSLGTILPFGSVTVLSLTSVSDILVTMGITKMPFVFPFGLVASWALLILAVNENINEAYRQLAYLKEKLENEVSIKTKELRSKAESLELTLDELKRTHASLIQSEKMAALGTLAAGLAHEINNSMNYVNGGLGSLSVVMERLTLNEKESGTIKKLMEVMNHGVKYTINVISSLRNYSGINQAKFRDVPLNEILDSVTTILTSKIKDRVTINRDFNEQLTVYGSTVGLNQIFMNLISNALDAIKDKGTINIRANVSDGKTQIEVEDSGHGIPEDIVNKVFDPFFTTKEVGSGTGLGLYIVKREIDSHKGSVAVSSVPERGTTFKLSLPKDPVKENIREIAA